MGSKKTGSTPSAGFRAFEVSGERKPVTKAKEPSTRTGPAQHEKDRLRSLYEQYKLGRISPETFDREIAQWQKRIVELEKEGSYTRAGNLTGIIQRKGGMTGGEPVGPGETGEEGGDETGGEGGWADADLPSQELINIIRGKGGSDILAAMMWEDALKGRAEGVATMEERLGEFREDPLLAAIKGKAEGMLSEDLVSEDELSRLLGVSDATLSRSYQNQSAALSAALGGRGIDPRSGVAQGLAARNRFNTLQQSAANRIGTTLQVEQLNRSALEDAMRLGVMTSSYEQGVLNQYASNIANLQAGQPLTQIGPEIMGMNVANWLDVGGDEPPPWDYGAILQGAGSGAMTGYSMTGSPYGAIGGALVGGGASYYTQYADRSRY